MKEFESTLTSSWQPAKTAPKNRVIIACFEDCPVPVSATWNETEEQWAFSLVDVKLSQGKQSNTFFKTEYECEDALKAWMPMPELA